MTLGSLFAGVGGFDLGFERAGMECRWQVEINPFRRAVLATHWPKVERHEDITKCGASNLARVDCITAGVPCQDWSVAGQRAGIKGSRSGLFFEFARILRELRPTWFVFENVPGLFSSNGGRDFAEVQRVLMVECGYGISWRVLNSQFFGVAQRRCRVYIVGCLGRPCSPEVLFESASGGGNPETGEETGAKVAAAVTGGIGRVGSRGADDGANIVAHTLRAQDGPHGASDRGDGQTNLIRAETHPDGVRDFAGLPKGMDSPRYQALGDAVTVQVTEWIAKRIIKDNQDA